VPETVVIGAGQAGLAVSHELERRDVDHVVLERGRVGQRWRTRWDSFCLVTPNWTVRLPGARYDGDDPDGYMARDEIVAHLDRWAERLPAPVHDGVEVQSLGREPGGGFRLATSDGELRARSVVVCTGAYQRPHRTPLADALPRRTNVLDSDGYTAPGDLPPGPVLIIGSGQTGCQLAEELRESGREVFLACGRAVWSSRQIGDHDLLWWLIETGFLDIAVEDLPSPVARLAGNVLATGRHGTGHDLHLRTLDAIGVRLLGHLEGCDGRRVRFADDLDESVAWGDARRAELLKLVRKLVAERGLPAPELEPPRRLRVVPLRELDLTGFGAVVVTAGFRPDYARWVRIPGAFDGFGFPRHRDGQSTVAPGLWFAGVHFLRKRKSALLWGVGEDAALVADGIAASRPAR
jgi:putative flavoprotein involved in K+ transport